LDESYTRSIHQHDIPDHEHVLYMMYNVVQYYYCSLPELPKVAEHTESG